MLNSRFCLSVVLFTYLVFNATSSIAVPTHSLSNGEWGLISIPADPGSTGTVRELFGDDLPADQYGSDKRWVLFAYDVSENRYLEIGIDDTLAANTGYWMIQLVAQSVVLDIPDTLTSLKPRSLPGCPAGQQCADKILEASGNIGWNMIGLSSDQNIVFGETRIQTGDTACVSGCTPGAASNADLSINQLFRFKDGKYLSVTEADSMQPWDGYWFWVNPTAQAPVWLIPLQPEAFGLTEREPLANLNLPFGETTVSDYRVENAYPNINFNEALFAANVPGEARLFYAERSGYIKVINDNAAVSESRTILDLSAKIKGAGGEQGLIGVALDPAFVQNRFVYLHYTIPSPLSSVISRFTWNRTTDVLDPASEKIVLEIPQPYTNHNGGGLAFGPKGHLFIALGDGGSGGDPLEHGQNLSTLLGSILRINVHPEDSAASYSIPADNPFVSTPGARPEIYAYGLRNPFRFSFDRQTDALWLGDVGQGKFEEVNKIVAGGNYGWRYYEGNSVFRPLPPEIDEASFQFPLYVYDHSEGISVIGGFVYRGSDLPSLVGKYVFGDFRGDVWALSLNGDVVVAKEHIAKFADVTNFTETDSGELLVVTRFSGFYRLIANEVGAAIPTLLSETGVFNDLSSLTPAQGFIPYQPNHAFWSDGVAKQRWIGVPESSNVSFSSDNWTFPVGSVSIKHFTYDQIENDPGSRRHLETRLMLHSEQGWRGFTYRWNSEQTDAELVASRETTTLSIAQTDGTNASQPYDFLGPNECFRCHTEVEGWTLGLSTAQLNGQFDYGQVSDNQIRSWNYIGMFDVDAGAVSQYAAYPSIDDAQAVVEARARAYLDVNCSVCHQPGGPTSVSLDFRASTALNAMNAIDVEPVAGNLGIQGASIIAPGAKERSILWHRMQRLDDTRMPPISSHVIDYTGVDVVGGWIDSLPGN